MNAAITLAIIKLTLLAVFGFFLYRKAVIDEKSLTFLTTFLISFAIPFLIFSRIVANRKLHSGFSPLLFLPISLGIFVLGLVLGFLFSLKRNHDFKKEFIGLVSFQNALYLPMSLAFALFPAAVREEFLLYAFLYLIGFDVLMWSAGSFLILKKDGDRYDVKTLFTPPIISIAVSLFLVYTGSAKFIPSFLMDTVKMLGDTSFVFSMLVLGCFLAKISREGMWRKFLITAEASILKLIVMPLVVLIFLAYFKIFSLLGMFILMQAAMPSASSLPIVAGLRGTDSSFVSQGVLSTHVLSIITIPLWLSLYLKISGFSW